MDGSTADREVEARANDLYWGSDLSVNQIAEDLDLSKGALYGMIRPLPTGLACPECGSEVVSPNRTARDREMVSCAECGWEGEEGDAHALGGEGAVVFQDHDEDVEEPEERAWRIDRTRTLWGGALLGAAAGLALVIWNKRR